MGLLLLALQIANNQIIAGLYQPVYIVVKCKSVPEAFRRMVQAKAERS
jgi:hypothetical protein